MTPVSIPVNEMTPFDLPKVCIVTGATENVSFKPAKFQWYPRWVAALAIAPLIMVIVMLVLMQKAEGQLPYSEAGWKQVKQKRMTAIAAIVLFLVCFFAGVVLLDGETAAFGGILMLVGVVALIAGIVMSRNGVPTVVKIDKQYIQLKVPSAEAAAAIAQHLVGGAARRAQAQQQAMYQQQQQYQQPPQG